ncbi:MAG: hypothetical protein LBL86_00985 [Coriobacteriales bacterium]|jgi:Tfp pilus assembly PilM family ATPase|nr:hypothetical protein [Coriobacteriales bacterium]
MKGRMLLSLYCSPSHLRLLVGSVSGRQATVDEFREIPLPERSTINGIITDRDAMLRFFGGVSQEFGPYRQDAALVIESGSIRTRLMTLPAVRQKRLPAFVRQEFGETGGEKDDVFDFAVLGPDRRQGGVEVLGIAAGKALLRSYLDVLETAGFRVRRIDVGANALVKAARFVPQLRASSSILMHSDDGALTIALFEQGRYRISQRYRLLHAPASPGHFQEVADNLSSMVQFQRSQHRDLSIETIHVLGGSVGHLQGIVEATRFLEIPVVALDLDGQVRLKGKASFDQGRFSSSRFLYNIGTLARR